MALMLGINKLLAMAKHLKSSFYCHKQGVFLFISCSIVLQLQGSLQKHLSPHQFGVSNLGGYETIFFGIITLLNLHLDWILMQVDVEYVFNSVF